MSQGGKGIKPVQKWLCPIFSFLWLVVWLLGMLCAGPQVEFSDHCGSLPAQLIWWFCDSGILLIQMGGLFSAVTTHSHCMSFLLSTGKFQLASPHNCLQTIAKPTMPRGGGHGFWQVLWVSEDHHEFGRDVHVHERKLCVCWHNLVFKIATGI